MKNFQLNTITFIETIYLLIPVALVLSRFVSELFVAIICIFFIFYSIKTRNFKYFKNKIFIIFLIFCIYLIILSFLKHQSVPHAVLFFFRFGLFAIATCFMLENNDKLLLRILLSIFVACLVVSLDAFVQFFLKINLLGYEYLGQGKRLSGLFKEELILGSYLSRFSPLFILQAFLLLNYKVKEIYKNFIFIFSFFLMFFCILYSGERTSFLYLIITLFFFLIVINSKKEFSKIIIIFFITFVSLFYFNDNRLFETTAKQVDGVVEIYKKNQVLKEIENFPIGHLKHWKSSFLMIKENFFFGVGPRMFREECDKDQYFVFEGCSTHPHNLYFQIFAESGLFGFLFLVITFIFIIMKLVKNFCREKICLRNNKTIIFISLIPSFLHFFPFLPNGDFFNNWLNILTFLNIGIFLYFDNKTNYV